MILKRREFLAIGATASAAALLPDLSGAADTSELRDPGTTWAVLIDTVVCIGCRKCEWACQDQHKLSTRNLTEFEDKSVFRQHRRPDAVSYTVVNRLDNPGTPDKPYSVKVQCMHCLEPACASACIVGALRKDARGPVVYDAWKCIGCRYCMVACPFEVPAYEYANALTPQVRKCTFCLERLEQGLKPACAAICPNEALTFGRRRDLLEVAKSRIMQNPGRYVDHIYGEHEAGGTGWMYLAGVDFAKTELPSLDERPVPALTESIQHGIFRSFVPPLALYGLLGIIMYSLRQQGSNHDHHEDQDASHASR